MYLTPLRLSPENPSEILSLILQDHPIMPSFTLEPSNPPLKVSYKFPQHDADSLSPDCNPKPNFCPPSVTPYRNKHRHLSTLPPMRISKFTPSKYIYNQLFRRSRFLHFSTPPLTLNAPYSPHWLRLLPIALETQGADTHPCQIHQTHVLR